MKMNIVFFGMGLFGLMVWVVGQWYDVEVVIVVNVLFECVWEVFIDMVVYVEWNLVIVCLSGELCLGVIIEFVNWGLGGR